MKGTPDMSTRREHMGSLGGGRRGAGLAGRYAMPAGQAASGQAGAGGPGASSVKTRKAKTTTLFKSPEEYPNALAVAPEGLWIGEQKTDHACLVDWHGKLLKTVKTESKNTSGMGVGGGFIWMGANAAPNGIFQTDIDAQTISQRPSPLRGGGLQA